MSLLPSLKNKMRINRFIYSIKKSSLFKDSFWAVCGNGLGNFLLLLSGILIARFLGKDLYGEYGMVKTTMFYVALFSTFALGDTSTKFVAEYMQRNKNDVPSIVRSSIRITLITSSLLCLCLIVGAPSLAIYINAPQLETPFRYLGIIIVFRALSTVCAGILGGFKHYKELGINNVISGFIMISLCIPLTLKYSLSGALCSLLISQLAIAALNLICVIKKTSRVFSGYTKPYSKVLLGFSYPFAINEFVYTFTSLGTNMLVTKYASTGELGMYTACSQWNSIILFMPSLLGNVVLSYLSTDAAINTNGHSALIRRMLLINLVCTLVPLLIVLLFSPIIVSYYGYTFNGMGAILSIMVLGTVFTCMTRVFQSELVSIGRKWTALIIRSLYNFLQIVLVYVVLTASHGERAALNMAYISVIVSIIAFVLYSVEYFLRIKNK